MIKKWIIISLIILFSIANIQYAINYGFLKDVFFKSAPSKERKINRDKISRFLTEINNSQLRDTEEGLLAAEKGSTLAIRKYAISMIRSGIILRIQLDDLAKANELVLPVKMSSKNLADLAELQKLEGKLFDAKFTETLEANYKWDKQEIERVLSIEDKEIIKFARERLHVLEENQKQLKI